MRAQVAGDPRPFSLYARVDERDEVVLVDVPTTMSVMEAAIEARYADLRTDSTSAAWEALEAQEINRFRDSLRRHLGKRKENAVKRRVRLVDWTVPGDGG